MKTRPGSLKSVLLFCGLAGAVAIAVVLNNSNNKPDVQNSATAVSKEDPADRAPSSFPLYGFNGNISHFPLSYSDKNFLDNIASLKPDIIRWPGGIISNIWDWRTGKADGKAGGNKYDLDDVKKLVDKVDCNILFTLNIFTHSLQDQIDMLESAKAMGIPVKYVEFGNEISNKNNPGRIRFNNSGANYGDTCRVWAAAIKKKFPNVKIAVWGENKPDMQNWVSGVLSKYKPDALVSHIYPRAADISNNGMVDTTRFGKWIENSFRRSGLDFSTPVWVTEYNIKQESLADFQPGEHEKALVFFTKKLTELGVQVMCVHNIVGKEGALAVKGNSITKQSTGIGFQQWMNSIRRK